MLPLAKVRLYESGVGYFERAGELRGDGAALPVPSAHLDDAIKSLVVLSRDGSVEDISFNSRLSPAVARARAGLPPDADEDLSYGALLETLKGASVELRVDGARVRGRLVEVAEIAPGEVGYVSEASSSGKRARGDDDDASDAAVKPSPQLFVTLYTQDGEFTRVPATAIDTLRPIDASQRRRFEAALEAQETTGYQTSTTMTLDASTQGPVRLGYLAEAPIWRTSFRLVFDDAGASTLQGWALVHNDTDEAWDEIALELVNGRPDSFLFPLAAPRYDRRGLETPERELSSIPQLLVTTPDAQWGDFADTWGGLSGTGSGYGSGSGAGFGGRGKRVPQVRQAKAAASSRTTGSDLLTLGDLATLAGATAKEGETVFVYSARRPLSLKPHRSAMVPFLSESIEATPIVRFASMSHQARHGIRLVNDTAKTLPPGPVSIFGGGGFMGESTIERLKPGERLFMEIGDDPDTELESEVNSFKVEHAKAVVYKSYSDELEEHYLRTREFTLTFTNRSGRAREVHLALDISRNARVEGADGLDYDSAADQPLAIFRLAANDNKPRTLVITEALKTVTSRAAIRESSLRELAAAENVPAERRAVLSKAAELMRGVKTAEDARDDVGKKLETAQQDIERYREHLKAMGDGERGGKSPIVTRLLAAEDRLGKLREELELAEDGVTQANAKVGEELAKLTSDGQRIEIKP
ncbi:MAG: hypothetical protein KC468_00860 [Myxococcales bacterium]|nr:hypothetical protein [Myxococcales bacterium]